jgi:hypothetical protein
MAHSVMRASGGNCFKPSTEKEAPSTHESAAHCFLTAADRPATLSAGDNRLCARYVFNKAALVPRTMA